MLENLRIQNFKSWQDTGNIDFSNLTGFFGTNSSGKSSILHFLLMLKQTIESSDRSQVLDLGDGSNYVDLGTLSDILHKKGNYISSNLLFTIEWSLNNLRWTKNKEKNEINFIDKISLLANIYHKNNNTTLIGFEYTVSDKKLGMSLLKNEATFDNKYALLLDEKPSVHKGTKKSEYSTPIKFYRFPNDIYIDSNAPEVLNMPIFEFEQLFERTFYLGPLREYPSRTYVWGGGQPSSVGNRGGSAIAALLASRQKGPTIDMGEGQPKRTVEEHVASWLKELGMIHSFIVQPIAPNRKEYEVRIQRTAESASVFLTDVGFGVSQILPVLVLLFYVPEGSTVILEQPEIHLHPFVQAGLADVFIDAIKRRRLQIILESHSEHLLQRLQRRMAEFGIEEDKGFHAGQAALYFTDVEAGKSKLTPLALDDYGNISNWPTGFFGDPFADAAALMDAQMRRKTS